MVGVTLKKEPLPGFITYEWLVRHGACADADIFKEMYPEGIQVTEEVIDALLEERIDLEFLIGVAYSIYEDKFQDRLHKKTSRAFKSHKETTELLWMLLDNAHKEFVRERVLALYEIAQNEDLPTQEGEQYRLDF